MNGANSPESEQKEVQPLAQESQKAETQPESEKPKRTDGTTPDPGFVLQRPAPDQFDPDEPFRPT